MKTKSAKKGFTRLKTWQVSHELMIKSYSFCKIFPTDEKYRRIDQIKRASSSIPANIAEGFGRFYFKENISFCRKARGSLEELKNHIMAARDLRQAPKDICQKLLDYCNEVGRLLNGYIRHPNKKK